MNAAYTLLEMELHPNAASRDSISADKSGISPSNQFNLRSYFDVTRHLEFDTGLYYVDSLPTLNIPGYVRLDMRLGWHPRENLEIILGLQNLLDPRHAEYSEPGVPQITTQAERSIYGMVRWRF